MLRCYDFCDTTQSCSQPGTGCSCLSPPAGTCQVYGSSKSSHINRILQGLSEIFSSLVLNQDIAYFTVLDIGVDEHSEQLREKENYISFVGTVNSKLYKD